MTRGSSVPRVKCSSGAFLCPPPRCGVNLWCEGPPGSRGPICPVVIFTTSSGGRKDRLWCWLIYFRRKQAEKLFRRVLDYIPKEKEWGEEIVDTQHQAHPGTGSVLDFNSDMFNSQPPASQAQGGRELCSCRVYS